MMSPRRLSSLLLLFSSVLLFLPQIACDTDEERGCRLPSSLSSWLLSVFHTSPSSPQPSLFLCVPLCYSLSSYLPTLLPTSPLRPLKQISRKESSQKWGQISSPLCPRPRIPQSKPYNGLQGPSWLVPQPLRPPTRLQ